MATASTWIREQSAFGVALKCRGQRSSCGDGWWEIRPPFNVSKGTHVRSRVDRRRCHVREDEQEGRVGRRQDTCEQVSIEGGEGRRRERARAGEEGGHRKERRFERIEDAGGQGWSEVVEVGCWKRAHAATFEAQVVSTRSNRGSPTNKRGVGWIHVGADEAPRLLGPSR